MAGAIKGITVEIGADTSKLSKALRSANAPVTKLKSELKGVEALLKMNPGNTDLIRQKQALLAQSIEKTKGNLKEMKAALEAAEASGATEKNSAAFRKLQREIIKTEAELKKLKMDAASMSILGSGVGVAAAKMDALGQKATALGQKMRGASIAIGLIGAAAVATTAEFDSSMSKVQAISGATGNQFQQLRDKAREMGESTKFTAAEAAEAMNYMAMAGWKTKEMLAGIEGVMYLAAASGEDLATTSDIVTDALTAMGYAASDSGRLADVMAAASANANTNVGMMGETFKYAAAVAGAMKYSMEDVALATGLMANSGIKATQAGTSLRSIMSRMAAPTKQVAGAMEKLGVSITDSSGNARPFRDVLVDLRTAMSGMSETEKTAAANAIAGKNAMSGFLALINSSDKDFNKLANAIDNSSGAAEEMANTMIDNLGGQVTILKSQLQELAIAAGDTLVPMVKKLVSAAQGLANWFNKLSPTAKSLAVKLALIAGATGPLLITFGALTSLFYSSIKAIAAAKAAVVGLTAAESGAAIASKALAVAQASIPWVAAAAGAALVAKAISDTYKATHEATIKAREHAQARQESINSIRAEATESQFYLQKLNELSGVENKTASQKQLMQAYVDQLNSSIEGLNLTYDAEKDKLSQTTDAIQKKIEAMKQEALAAAYVKNAKKAYEEYANAEIKHAEAKEELAAKQAQWNSLSDSEKQTNAQLAREIFNLKGEVNDYSNAMQTAIQDANKWTNASQLTAQGWKDIKQQAKEAGVQIPQSVTAGLRSGLYTVPQSLAELKALIKFDDLKQRATGDAQEVANRLAQGLANGSITAQQAAKQLSAAVDTGLSETGAAEAGTKAGSDYATSVAGQAGNAASAGRQLHAGAKGGAKGSLASEGKSAGTSYGTSVGGTSGSANKAGGKLVAAAKKGANKPSALTKIGKSIGEGLAEGMRNAYEAVKRAANKLIEKANEAAKAKAKVNSPSKLFRDGVGIAIPEGVAAGINKGSGMVKKASASMVSAAELAAANSATIISAPKAVKAASVAGSETDIVNGISTAIALANTTPSQKPIQITVNLGGTKVAEQIYKLNKQGQLALQG